MNRLTKNLFIVSVSICLILTLLFTGCTRIPQEPEQTAPTVPPPTPTPVAPQPTPPVPGPITATSAPGTPMKATLMLSEKPLLGKPVVLTASFSMIESGREDAPNTAVELILPEGFELVSENKTATLDVMRNAPPAQFQFTIKAVKTGYWDIRVKAVYNSPGYVGGIAGANVYLYANISETSAEVSDVPLGPKGIGHGGPSTGPPAGWKPPPGYENITPVAPSPPPVPEPPAQDVPPAKAPSIECSAKL